MSVEGLELFSCLINGPGPELVMVQCATICWTERESVLGSRFDVDTPCLASVSNQSTEFCMIVGCSHLQFTAELQLEA